MLNHFKKRMGLGLTCSDGKQAIEPFMNFVESVLGVMGKKYDYSF